MLTEMFEGAKLTCNRLQGEVDYPQLDDGLVPPSGGFMSMLRVNGVGVVFVSRYHNVLLSKEDPYHFF